MKKIIVAYASMSGNTELMARYITEGIKESNYEVCLKDALQINVEDLSDYAGIVLGTYSWDGIPDEFLDIYDGIENLDLTGKKAAVFGSGDTMYLEYCIAVDEAIMQLKKSGAEIVLEGLKVELTPIGDDIERCIEFGRQFVKILNAS
jgi:flavodoxin I